MISISQNQRYIRVLFTLVLAFILLSIGLAVKAEEAETFSGTIAEAKISGNRLISDEEILNSVSSYPGMQFSRQTAIQDLKRIYQLGYFVQKSVEVRPFQKPDGTIILEYRVKENPPITDLIVYGNNAVSEVDAYAYFADLVARPENAGLISNRIKELERAYIEKGYIVARVKDLDLDQDGTLKIYIDEGIISEIKYIGNTRTQSSYLNHLVSNTKVNQPYNEANFVKDFRKIKGTGYFNDVTRMVKPSMRDDGYTLEINLAEKEKRTTLGLGGGINSSAGLFGNASFARNNIRGKGETLNINALLGSGFGAGTTLNTNSRLVQRGRVTQLGASYIVPYYRDSPYSFGRYLNFSRGPNFTVDLSKQTLISGSLSASRNIGTHHGFRLGTSYNFIDIQDRNRSRFINSVAENILDIDDISNQDLAGVGPNQFLGGRKGIAKAEAKRIRAEQIVDGQFFDLKTTYIYTNLDSPSKPRDGWKSRFGLVPTLGFGEVDSFTKSNASISRFFKLPKESTLIFNVRGGYQVLGDIPQFSKFRLGSSTGVRGYRLFSELGVGSKLLISTAEVRTPIYNAIPSLKNNKLLRNLDLATFFDAGLVGGDVRLNRVTDRLSQAMSFGFGIRVNIPLVGALRLDIGFPLIDVLTGSDKLFRFNFGPANFF